MNEESPFSVQAIELGPMENFIYLITDTASGRTAVVDPAWEPASIIAEVEKQGTVITDILLTHSHHDHINGIEEILNHYDAQLHLTRAEARFWGAELDMPTLHHGGDVIQLGNTDIRILHTPGHTPGSACYHLGDQLIAGDTLFVFGCGRCDLRGGDPEELYSTLRKLRNDLPASTLTLPGHNYSTQTSCTLAEQESGNPFMHFEDKNKFVEFRMQHHDHWRKHPMAAINRDETEQFR